MEAWKAAGRAAVDPLPLSEAAWLANAD